MCTCMPRSTTGPKDELVREALDGLFGIAAEDRPSSVQASLREQIDELPIRECRSLVEQLVDTDELAQRIREREGSDLERPPRAPDARLRKVDGALEPLAALTMGEEGVRALDGMAGAERFHVLFSSLGPSTETPER